MSRAVRLSPLEMLPPGPDPPPIGGTAWDFRGLDPPSILVLVPPISATLIATSILRSDRSSSPPSPLSPLLLFLSSSPLVEADGSPVLDSPYPQ